MKKLALVAALACAALGAVRAQEKPAAPQPQEGMLVQGATLGQLVEDCQRQAKKRFVYDEQVATGFMQKKVHVVLTKMPANAEEFFAVFQSVLQVNGLAVLPAGKPGEELWKIVPAQNAPRLAVPVLATHRGGRNAT